MSGAADEGLLSAESVGGPAASASRATSGRELETTDR